MGMGYAGNCADVIEQDNLKKIVPDWEQNYNELVGMIIDAQMSMDDFACELEFGQSPTNDDEDEPWKEKFEKAVAKWDSMRAAFNRATKVNEEDAGLDLEFRYHNSEINGDRYDDVDGVFFHVVGVYQLTPAGEKFKDMIERKFFVQYG